MAKVKGAELLVRCLQQHGVQFMFGIVGTPVTPIAETAQSQGLRFFGMHIEQSAAYAAQAASYLSGRPAVALVVGGPALLNAVPGLANARHNSWPLVLIGGAPDSHTRGMGAFHDAPHLEAVRPWVKYAMQVDHLDRIPYFVEQAVRTATYGRPGPVYLELSADIITGVISEETVAFPPPVAEPPRSSADPAKVEDALAVLRSAERPLVVVGKGAACAGAEDEVRAFIDATQLPFLSSPMGKGVVGDDHPLSMELARTYALREADVIFLLASRFDWRFHFGTPPQLRPDVRVIQLDMVPEEIGTNVAAKVGLVGDAKEVMAQLNAGLRERPWRFGPESAWMVDLATKVDQSRRSMHTLLDDAGTPIHFYRALREVNDLLGDDDIIVNEGAHTQEIGRHVLKNRLPRHRLDAGPFGAMGVGVPYAIAAQAVFPGKRVVTVQGDSAFGFSGMEIEVAARYRLPITFVICNNNGIGGGPTTLLDPPPVGALYPGARYDRMMIAFGGEGFSVERPEDLRPALERALRVTRPSLVNIAIDPTYRRSPEESAWLTS